MANWREEYDKQIIDAIDVVVGAVKETMTDEIESDIYPQIGADVVLRLLESGLMEFTKQ